MKDLRVVQTFEMRAVIIDVQTLRKTLKRLIGLIESSVIGPFFYFGTVQSHREYQNSGSIVWAFPDLTQAIIEVALYFFRELLEQIDRKTR
jgi:hypothetical protein